MADARPAVPQVPDAGTLRRWHQARLRHGCRTTRRRRLTSWSACSSAASAASISGARRCCFRNADSQGRARARAHAPQHSLRENTAGLKFLEAAHVKEPARRTALADNPRNRIAAFRVLKLLRAWVRAHAARLRGLRGCGIAGPRWLRTPCHRRRASTGRGSPADGGLGAESRNGQAGDAVRTWYEPQLERLYDVGAGASRRPSSSSSA